MDKVKIVFENNEEIINVVNNGNSIVKLLGYPSNEKCSLIGAEIKLDKKVGKGAFGSVYLISFPGMGAKKYVIKKGDVEFHVNVISVDDIIKCLISENLTWDDVKPFQTARTIRVFETENNPNKKVNFVFPPDLCLVSDTPDTFTRIPASQTGGDIVTVPVGSYLCGTNAYSEYVIGVYMGYLYRKFTCINFFDVHSMFTCPNDTGGVGGFFQYILMDKIDGDLSGCKRCTDTNLFVPSIKSHANKFTLIDSIYVQTLIAIACYQKKYEISHNDLHPGNVFLEYVTKDTEYNGQKLHDADWFHYIVGGKNIYLPATDIIVKIGDFGLSVKYSDPIVGDKEVFETGYDQYDGNGPWIPNVYMKCYDSFFFTCAYSRTINADMASTELSPLIVECLGYMYTKLKLKNPNAPAGFLKRLTQLNMIRPDNTRPVLDNLHLIKKSAYDIVREPVYNKYGQFPTYGKIVDLGEF